MTMSRSKYVGIDGCKAGWFTVGLDDDQVYETKVFEAFSELVDHYRETRLVLVDMPIGLPGPGPDPRDCDTEARKRLGNPRGSGVFRVPIREVAYMVSDGASREKADRRSRDLDSKGIGVQAFNIMNKIAEIDRTLSSRANNTVPTIREAHPEVCFWGLNGNSPMRMNKKRQGGIAERLSVLQRLEPRTEAIYQSAVNKYLRQEVARDDILDALVNAVTAKLGYQEGYNLKTLPDRPPKDSKGLPMEMVYVAKRA